MILDPTDQNIRDQGFNFVPFDRYLAAPFQPSNISFDVNTGAGIPTALPRRTMPTGGEGIGPGVNLGPDSRGFLTGDFRNFEPNYSYTPPAYDEFTEKSMFDKFKDKMSPAIDFGKKAAGFVGKGILSAASGFPFAGEVLSSLPGKFENRQLSAGVIDEFGNVYDEEELNKQNALGGYYSEAARSGRRRSSRIANMLERLALGKKISYKNLMELQAQEKKEQEIAQAAAQAMQDQNRAEGRGGYQAGYGSDFMEGPSGAGTGLGASDKGGSDSMGSSKDGGIIGYGGTSGTPRYQQFMDGGLADLVDIYD